jgi:hypothetical protein
MLLCATFKRLCREIPPFSPPGADCAPEIVLRALRGRVPLCFAEPSRGAGKGTKLRGAEKLRSMVELSG